MKSDLNLLPIRHSVISKQAFIGILSVSVVFLSLIGYFFVYLPIAEKREISKEINKKEAELITYAGYDEEFQRLLEETKELQEMVSVVDALKNRHIILTERLNDISNVIPVDITLKSISYADGIMEIGGVTSGQIQVAQFMVKLRQMEAVLRVALTSVGYKEDTAMTDSEAGNSDEYNFILTVFYHDIVSAELDIAEINSIELDSSNETGGE